MNITFSIVQINCLLDQYETNFEKVRHFLYRLPDADKHLVVLPELWSSGFTENVEQAHSVNQEILNQLYLIAKDKNLLIAGSYIIKQNYDFYNQLVIISPDNQVATYNKTNLFPQLNEFTNFKPGSGLSILKIWNLKIGMVICYDLRFPEIFRHYASQKVEICILPAQWPHKRINHFNALLLARAIENQMIIASSNVCGNINKTNIGGSSSVIDHMGIVQAHLEGLESFSSIQIDIEDLYHWRKEFPVLEQTNLLVNAPINYFDFNK